MKTSLLIFNLQVKYFSQLFSNLASVSGLLVGMFVVFILTVGCGRTSVYVQLWIGFENIFNGNEIP